VGFYRRASSTRASRLCLEAKEGERERGGLAAAARACMAGRRRGRGLARAYDTCDAWRGSAPEG
jgi:hypothetical protein